MTFYGQCAWLAEMRTRMPWLKEIPILFARDALRRVDRGMKAFFRRVKAGEKAGFPRFKNRDRYRSMEYLQTQGNRIRERAIFVPGIGLIAARGQFGVGEKKELLLQVVKRATGWHALVVVEKAVLEQLPGTGQECGVDLGLETFATLDSGEQIENPRTLRKSARKLKRCHQRLARCKKGSNRRKNAKREVAKIYEKMARQRRGFCHRMTRNLVNRFDRIAVEKLNIKGLASGMLAKSVNDAAWGIFLFYLSYKAANAGRTIVEVNPSGTSQECPACGRIARKELSEREHNCPCGLRCHRDHAAAQVIRQRAFRPERGEPIRPGTKQAGPKKRKDQTIASTQ